MFRLFADLEPLADVPIIVTQHLPAPFVPVLAEHLARHARRRAVVAEEGLQLEPGTIHVAPGTAHVRLSERRGRHVISLDDKPAPSGCRPSADPMRSEEHKSELQSLMRISYAVFCLKKKTKNHPTTH